MEVGVGMELIACAGGVFKTEDNSKPYCRASALGGERGRVVSSLSTPGARERFQSNKQSHPPMTNITNRKISMRQAPHFRTLTQNPRTEAGRDQPAHAAFPRKGKL